MRLVTFGRQLSVHLNKYEEVLEMFYKSRMLEREISKIMHKKGRINDRIVKAYKEIAFAPDISVQEKMKKLRYCYRQTWFDSWVDAEHNWQRVRAERLASLSK